MDESAGHRHEPWKNPVEQPHAPQRRDAPVGERQVDGTARLRRRAARIPTALVDRHAQPAPAQQDREQRTGRARADDAHAVAAPGGR